MLNIFLFLVLSDLDELKKTKEGARNAIKWMESEFKKGNRYMRSQRSSELLAMPLLKVPKKLGKIILSSYVRRFLILFSSFSERDSAIFMHIVQFANFIVSNNRAEDSSNDCVLTLLTGDNLDERKKQLPAPSTTTNNCINQIGILETIPVKYCSIVQFYSKYKKK